MVWTNNHVTNVISYSTWDCYLCSLLDLKIWSRNQKYL